MTSDPLVEQLVARGMTERIALKLAAEQREECERQLQYLPYREVKNTGGTLRQAIGEAWAAPPGFLAAQERQRMQESARLRALEAAAKAAREAELHAAQEAALAAWWAALGEERQAEYTEAAREALFAHGSTIRIHFERCPQSLFAALRPYLLERMEGEEPL